MWSETLSMLKVIKIAMLVLLLSASIFY